MEEEKNLKKAIKDWAADDRPREKMLKNGAESLSNSELLAILIATGSRSKSAIDLAKEVLELGNNNLNELGRLQVNELKKISGIGEAKAITIAAALELGRRRQAAQPIPNNILRTSRDLADILKAKFRDLNYEVFAVVYLNQRNKIKNIEVVSRGGITGTVADPRIILKKALLEEATGIVLCHNHPSGNLKPSNADMELTNKITQAAKLMDIKVLDHLIVSEEGYFSFADEGIL